MNLPLDSLRKLLSVGISLLLLSVSVAIPLMDRGELSTEQAVESGHDPSRCPHAHDHTVCTQVVANASLALGTYQHRADHVIARARTPADPEQAAGEIFLDGHPSRAPPLA